MNNIEKLYIKTKNLNVFKKGNFTLSSGRKSNYYLDGRILSLDPVAVDIISNIFFDKINFEIDKVGGPATAAIPLISSFSLYAKYQFNKVIPGFYVRSANKEHGLTNKIEGGLKKGDNVVIIDDTVTTGGSIINTINEIKNYGANVKYSLSVFDRNEGGIEKIEKTGVVHYSIFKYDHKKGDLIF